jgi:hypothetical protein
MYLALFLAPWMMGYAISTIAMNHRMPRPTAFVIERDQQYPNVFEPGTPPRDIARQILADLGSMALRLQGPAADGRLTINRQGMLSPAPHHYTPADRRIVVERMELETSGFLNRFHRPPRISAAVRRGSGDGRQRRRRHRRDGLLGAVGTVDVVGNARNPPMGPCLRGHGIGIFILFVVTI